MRTLDHWRPLLLRESLTIDAFSHQPTHADIASDVKALYLGHLKLNLINDYIQTRFHPAQHDN